MFWLAEAHRGFRRSHKSRNERLPLSLDANHLAQGMHDLHQILLRRHHLIDGFVSRWLLIHHCCILAAFDVCGRLDVVIHTDQLLGLGTLEPAQLNRLN